MDNLSVNNQRRTEPSRLLHDTRIAFGLVISVHSEQTHAPIATDKPSAGRQRERPAIRGDGRRPLLPERQRPAPIRYVHNGQLVGCYEGARSEACRESYATTCRRYSVEIRQKEACLGNAVSGLCIHTAMATQRSPVFCAVAGAATFTIAAALH